MAGLLDVTNPFLRSGPRLGGAGTDSAPLSAITRALALPSMAASPPPISMAPAYPHIMSPDQLRTILGIREIGDKLRAANEASTAPTTELPPDIAANIAKAAAMRQDANSLEAKGLPGYFDQQARTGVGMAPGPIQFNMPGPKEAPAPSDLASILNAPATRQNADQQVARALSLPQSVDPATELRGSLQNNMRKRFSGPAPARTAAELAVAERKPNLGLSPKDFLAKRNQANLDSANQNYANDQAAYLKNPSKAGAGGLKDRNEAVAAISPTAAQANTTLTRMAKLRGVAPDQLLAQNAAAAPAKKAAKAQARMAAMQGQQGAPGGGDQFAGMMIPYSPNGYPGMSPAEVVDHNRHVVAMQLDQKNRQDLMGLEQGKLGLGREELAQKLALAQQQHQALMTQAQQNHEAKMAEMRAQIEEMNRRFGLDQKVADAKIANMQNEADAANPQSSLNKALMSGQATPEALQHLQELHSSADLYPGPDWFFRGPYEDYLALHRHFGQAHPEVPKPALKSLLDQYFLRSPQYGSIPQPTGMSKLLGMTGSLFDKDFRY